MFNDLNNNNTYLSRSKGPKSIQAEEQGVNETEMSAMKNVLS